MVNTLPLGWRLTTMNLLRRSLLNNIHILRLVMIYWTLLLGRSLLIMLLRTLLMMLMLWRILVSLLLNLYRLSKRIILVEIILLTTS